MLHKTERGRAERENLGFQPETRKPYTKPEIILELELETRAGSPLIIDPLDPFGLEPKK